MIISDVMKLTGLSRKAIYLYEERGFLSPAKKQAGEVREYREYTEDDVERLRLIARLRELDVSLSDISKALSGVSIDLVLQNHLDKQRAKLNEVSLTIDKLSTALNELPPNACFKELDMVLDGVIKVNDQQLSHKLNEDFSKSQVRRVTMLLYEAFLDKPLSTKAQWNDWYSMLDLLESTITPDMIEAHWEFYGMLTTEQLCEDYELRRRLVCGYTNYGPMEERAKAEELVAELKTLITNEVAFDRWFNYYQKMVVSCVNHSISNPEVFAGHIYNLSNVYASYESHFIEMMNEYFLPIMDQPEGRLLKKMISEKMAGNTMTDFNTLIYFDFYNNTLRKILYKA